MKTSVRPRKPSKQDVSRPGKSGYSFKKQFYRDRAVAEDYDFHRFGSARRERRNARKWRAIRTGLDLMPGVSTILDLPCGTGRFTGALAGCGYRVVGSDISLEMMQVAKSKTASVEKVCGYLQADAEALPFGTDSIDCVVCIRFLFHVDAATRVRMLREMGRISRLGLIVDYRHRYSLRYKLWRLKRRLGLTKSELPRVSRDEMERELRQAGLEAKTIIPVARFFSDKWIVVAHPRATV